jgi:hypothetical protein
MIAKELKALLENVPDNMDIFIEKFDDDFGCSLANQAKVKSVGMRDGKLYAEVDVFVISDEI